MKVAREMARIISAGCITYTAVAKKLRGKVESRIVHKCICRLKMGLELPPKLTQSHKIMKKCRQPS